MEISELYTADAHNEGAEMQVKDQFGAVTDIFITLKGRDSTDNLLQQRKQLNDFYAKLAAGKSIGDDEDIDVEQTVNLTCGWRGIEQDGEPLEFTKDRARELYQKAPYIHSQAEAFILDRKNFTQAK